MVTLHEGEKAGRAGRRRRRAGCESREGQALIMARRQAVRAREAGSHRKMRQALCPFLAGCHKLAILVTDDLGQGVRLSAAGCVPKPQQDVVDRSVPIQTIVPPFCPRRLPGMKRLVAWIGKNDLEQKAGDGTRTRDSLLGRQELYH
jgi:hypothetical protein